MSERAARDLYVTELSFETTEEDIRKLFALCGTVRAVKMMTATRGQFSGSAYVRMSSDKENREAVDMLDGIRLLERRIKVSLSRTKTERESQEKTPVSKVRNRKKPIKQNKVR